MPSSAKKHAEYMRARYHNDPEYRIKHKKLVAARRKQYQQEVHELLQSLKICCLLCPETAQCCLSFHHVDAKDKDFTIAQAGNGGYSRERIAAEIAKCVILCENCHRKVHAGLISLLRGSVECIIAS